MVDRPCTCMVVPTYSNADYRRPAYIQLMNPHREVMPEGHKKHHISRPNNSTIVGNKTSTGLGGQYYSIPTLSYWHMLAYVTECCNKWLQNLGRVGRVNCPYTEQSSYQLIRTAVLSHSLWLGRMHWDVDQRTSVAFRALLRPAGKSNFASCNTIHDNNKILRSTS